MILLRFDLRLELQPFCGNDSMQVDPAAYPASSACKRFEFTWCLINLTTVGALETLQICP